MRLAHECPNASRSDTGSQDAAHGNWIYISEAEVVGFISGMTGADPTEVGDAFLAEVEAQGLQPLNQSQGLRLDG